MEKYQKTGNQLVVLIASIIVGKWVLKMILTGYTLTDSVGFSLIIIVILDEPINASARLLSS